MGISLTENQSNTQVDNQKQDSIEKNSVEFGDDDVAIQDLHTDQCSEEEGLFLLFFSFFINVHRI